MSEEIKTIELNAEKDYKQVPISVLRYISILESERLKNEKLRVCLNTLRGNGTYLTVNGIDLVEEALKVTEVK